MSKYEYAVERILRPRTQDIPLMLRATKHSAGYDLFAHEDVEIFPKSHVLVPVGFILYLPPNAVGLIFPKSGKATKQNLVLKNCVGVIDADYNEEVMVPIKYDDLIGQPSKKIIRGTAIAQIMFTKYDSPFPEFDLDITRNGGFGSTDSNIN